MQPVTNSEAYANSRKSNVTLIQMHLCIIKMISQSW